MNNSRQDIRLGVKDEAVLITGRPALEKKEIICNFCKTLGCGRIAV